MNVTYQRAGPVQYPSHLGTQIGLIGDAVGGETIGLRDFTNVGKGLAGSTITANSRFTEEIGLRCADRRIALVIQHEEFDGQVQARDGLQFLNIELESAVAVHANGVAAIAGDTHADGGCDAKTHGAQRRGMKNALSGLNPQGQEK